VKTIRHFTGLLKGCSIKVWIGFVYIFHDLVYHVEVELCTDWRNSGFKAKSGNC
jgi:hypothetical protein